MIISATVCAATCTRTPSATRSTAICGRVMQQVAGKPILAIEHDFTRQAGVPLVRVTRTSQGRTSAGGPVRAGSCDIKSEPSQTWRLPLAIRSSDGSEQTVLLRGAADLAFQLPALVNAGQLGYARVLYDNDTFDALAADAGYAGTDGPVGPVERLVRARHRRLRAGEPPGEHSGGASRDCGPDRLGSGDRVAHARSTVTTPIRRSGRRSASLRCACLHRSRLASDLSGHLANRRT